MRADAARAAAMHTAATGTLDALRAIATAQCSPRLHATHTMRIARCNSLAQHIALHMHISALCVQQACHEFS